MNLLQVKEDEDYLNDQVNKYDLFYSGVTEHIQKVNLMDELSTWVKFYLKKDDFDIPIRWVGVKEVGWWQVKCSSCVRNSGGAHKIRKF